ncbi:MAG: FG-GAP repeat domain-containing protein [Planctomycetota bacterium]|jgi:hypothetical protein
MIRLFRRQRTGRSRRLGLPGAVATGLALLGTAGARAGGGAPIASLAWERASVLAPDFPTSTYRLVDLDGDGAAELLVVGRQGQVRTWRHEGKTILAERPSGTLDLPDPAHCILAVDDVLGTGGPPQLVVASPSGVRLYRPDPDAGFVGEGEALTGRARFRIRVGAPTYVDFVQDINNDGGLDLVLPAGDYVELWMNDGPPPHAHTAASDDAGSDLPVLRRAGKVSVRVKRDRATDASALSDQLESIFTIPRLETRDFNGDGRPDLLVDEGRRRSFHLQREDGSIPVGADVAVNLTIFRDTTSEASIRPGRTLAGPDRAVLEIEDLDNDGIPDFVIAHRRKVWVFHGTRAGPQFTEPSSILKVADDVTLIGVLPLDDDPYADLFILKVQVPSVASIAVGIMGDLDVEITALGYAGDEGRTFKKTPSWRGELTVRLPPILEILKNPEALLRRLDEAAARLRTTATGDCNGDGIRDQLMVSEDRKRVEYWQGRGGDGADADDDPIDIAIRRYFFEDTDRMWDLDRILNLIGDLADAVSMTGDRPPDATFDLGTAGGSSLQSFGTGDLNGDGRDEVVVEYHRNVVARATAFAVFRLGD